jgi:transcription elongation factor Elf1
MKSTGGVPKDKNVVRAGVAKKSTGGVPKSPFLILVKPDSAKDEDVSVAFIKEEPVEDDDDVFPCNDDDDVEYVPDPMDVVSDDSCPSFEFGGDGEGDRLLACDDIRPASTLKIVSVRSLPAREKPNPFVSLSKLDPATLKKYGVKVKKPRVRRKPGAAAKNKKKGPYPCEKCDEIFQFKVDYLKHKPKHRVPKRYTCQFCGFTTHRKQYHFVHVRSHTGEKPHLCEICGFATSSPRTLQCHIKRIHKPEELEMKYACSFCGKRFQFRGTMIKHEARLHKEVNEFAVECDLCKLVCFGKPVMANLLNQSWLLLTYICFVLFL